MGTGRFRPRSAMVLAAGLGSRLRPITDVTPKPLVEVAGRSLLDRGLDQLERAGVRRAVVNVHHLGVQIIAHCASRVRPGLTISDERDHLLDSGGGVVKALPQLGRHPFLILNADTFWHDPEGRVLDAMIAAWDGRRMDMLLLVVDQRDAIGHSGGGDFVLGDGGRLIRATGAAKADAPVYAGVIIAKPQVFAQAPQGAHSLNLHFDRLIARGRLRGHLMDAPWITVGTPQGLADAEAAMQRFGDV
jgi:MurNAc alpha-1-phosphate uridylyltransferase